MDLFHLHPLLQTQTSLFPIHGKRMLAFETLHTQNRVVPFGAKRT
jgi:hypothetical protein